MTDVQTVAVVDLVRPAGNIGAEIRGVDAAGPLDDSVVAGIRAALLRHKVVFLRGQRLTYDQQVAFGRRFGELTLGHPIFPPVPDKPYQREFDSRQGTKAHYWHSDLTFLDRPPAFGQLHAMVIPPVGGDTIWANGVTAYDTLPEPLRRLADALRVVHSNDCDYIDATMPGGRLDYIRTAYEAEHPAVRVHPETRERSLMLGGFARNVPGFGPQASRELLSALQAHATLPEHTVRWKWQVGDLVLWDNRATQHYAVYDYGAAHRRLERVTVSGDVPVGVDGRPSTVVRGDSATYTGPVS